MAGDLPQLFDHRPLRRLRRIPWVKALRTVSGAVTVSPNEVRADGVVEADASLLRPSDLPVQAGDGPPPLVGSLTSVSGASVNQSQTTAFLLRAARAACPRSRFVRDVRRLERAHKSTSSARSCASSTARAPLSTPGSSARSRAR